MSQHSKIPTGAPALDVASLPPASGPLSAPAGGGVHAPLAACSWAVWDIETLRWAVEVPGGWRNPAGFGIAVAKALDERGVMHTFYEDDAPALIEFLASKDLTVGFNNLRFDCGVLSGYGDVGRIRAHSLDLLASLSEVTGIPHCVSLERASRATLGAGKLLADGGEAVILWRRGTLEDRRTVEEYCEQDVRLTHRLWEFGARHGHVLAPIRPARGPRRLAAHPTRVPVRWPVPAIQSQT